MRKAFFVHFFAAPARLRHEMTKFSAGFFEDENGKALNSTNSV